MCQRCLADLGGKPLQGTTEAARFKEENTEEQISSALTGIRD